MPAASPRLKMPTGRVARSLRLAICWPTRLLRATTSAGLAPPSACMPDRMKALRRPLSGMVGMATSSLHKLKLLANDNWKLNKRGARRPERGHEAFGHQQGLAMAPEYGAARQQLPGLRHGLPGAVQGAFDGAEKRDGAIQAAAQEGGPLYLGVVVEHVGQGAAAQAPYALPDAVRGGQGREAAGDHAAHAVDGHGDFAYPGERAARPFNQRGFLGVQAAGVLAHHVQAHLAQAPQAGGQGAGAVQPVFLGGRGGRMNLVV